MERVHLARKFVSIEGGARHYYEEEIFDNYDAAHSFIQNISEEDEDFFLSEIVSCKLNDTYSKYDKEVHIFNKNGVLIWSNNSPHSSSKKKFSGKFSVGDIVILQAFPWISSSPTHVSTIGVVAEVPILILATSPIASFSMSVNNSLSLTLSDAVLPELSFDKSIPLNNALISSWDNIPSMY